MADPQVTDKRGVIEYILGGETGERLLNARVFDKRTTKAVYRRQTDAAKAAGVSNCPMCAASGQPNLEKAHLQGVRDGRRPRHRMEPRRGDRRIEPPDAARNTQPLEGQPLEPMRTSRSLSSAAPPA